MENRKYVVHRDEIYVGEVVRTNRIYSYQGESKLFRDISGRLDTGSWKSYRSMLFVPNEDKWSNDLLYQSPNYPILNVTDDETCLNLREDNIVIRDACNLAALLEYFGYKKDLTYEDIMKIRKTFFTGNFVKKNCEVFGYKEIMAEDLTFYVKGEKVTNPIAIAKRKMQYRLDQLAGHRMFSGVSDSPLPSEYWDVLDDRGDNALVDVIKCKDEKINAFAPHRSEGPVRRLKKF